MDDLTSHFYVTVGQLLDQAALGGFRIQLDLRGGGVADGVPTARGEGAGDQLDDTGYARRFEFDGAMVSLASVTRAAVLHPGDDS